MSRSFHVERKGALQILPSSLMVMGALLLLAWTLQKTIVVKFVSASAILLLTFWMVR